MGLWYSKDSGFELIAYSDANHACIDGCKSTSGGIQFLGEKFTSHIWIRTQLLNYGFRYNKIPMYCDSKITIAISCNPIQHSRTKHINIRYYFIKEHVEKATIELYFVRTEYQLADLFTKALPKERFEYLVYRTELSDAIEKLRPEIEDEKKWLVEAQQPGLILGWIEAEGLTALIDHDALIEVMKSINNSRYIESVLKEWRKEVTTVSKVSDTKDTIKFKLDKQKIFYTVDMFRATLHLPLETTENPIIAPATMRVIEPFMQTVRYQGVVDKVSAFYMKFLAQPWQIMFKVFNRMLILDAFLTDEIRATDDYKEYETVFVRVVVPTIQPQPVVSTQGTYRNTPSAHRSPTLTATSRQQKKRKNVAGETSSSRKSLKVTIKQKKKSTTPIPPPSDDRERDEIAKATLLSLTMHKTALATEAQENIAKVQEKLEEEEIEKMIKPGSHKENPKTVDDDDEENENENEKKDDKKDDEEKDNNDHIDHTLVETQETGNTVSPSTATTSKDPHQKRRISSKYSHLPGALRRMCKRQGYMIRDMKIKCVTNIEFWKVHGKVDKVLHEIVPQIAERATNDLIEGNLKRVVANTIIQERDAFQAEVHAVISKEFAAHASKIIEELFKSHMQNNMKSNIQDQANDPALWDVLKRKFEKSSSSNTSCRDDVFHSYHQDDHHEDDAPLEGEKREKNKRHPEEWDAWVEETIIDEDEVIPEDVTPEMIDEFQNIDKHIPTIYDRAKMKATLIDMMSNPLRNVKENPNEPPRYLYNKDLFFLKYENTEERSYILSLHKIHAVSFLEEDLEEKITKVVIVTTDQHHWLDFMEQIIVMRENDKPYSFSKADFNIEAHDPYSIVEKPNTGLIYLNSKEEKRVMHLAKIVKFYDATLEKVLKEVKLKIFKSEPWKKPHLLIY
ncbi:hypothetical protein Tco_0324659 [Tanacetum coccineum]